MAEKVVTFGEIMLRLCACGYERLLQSPQLQATFGGGEANVAVSLANFGLHSVFVTKLPTHTVGQAAVNALRGFGVDTSRIVRGGERLGLYFLETGASQRGSSCIYDRADTAISQASPAEFDWPKLLCDANWLHITGITPALSDGMATACLQACQTARAMGVHVSCDLNYRENLWTREKAGQVLGELCRFVDVCICNEADARDIFGIAAPGSDVGKGQLDPAGYEKVAQALVKQFGFSCVAFTLRRSISANDNDWGAMLFDRKTCYFSPTYRLHIVDRVGGGDAFAAGLIYALLRGDNGQTAVDFAAAASALKHTIPGDFNRVNVQEVERLVQGDASGRIRR